MLRNLSYILIAAILIIGNGCATRGVVVPQVKKPQTKVVSSVTAFHNLSGKLEKSIKVVPFDNSLESSLQFQNYATTIVSFLEKFGFSTVGENQEPDYIVFVSYGIGSGNTSVSSSPVIGRTGGGYTDSRGTVLNPAGGMKYFSGSSYSMPTYGVVGTRTSTSTEYTRNLAIDIVDTPSLNSKKPKKIYEGRVESSGSCSEINYVIDEMMQSLLKDFPGTSGKSKKVKLPSKVFNEC